MNIINTLTNEGISKNFSNQFDLVNYAIKLAVNMIQSGREPRVRLNTENPALLTLAEIAEGKDTFIEIVARSDERDFKQMKFETPSKASEGAENKVEVEKLHEEEVLSD